MDRRSERIEDMETTWGPAPADPYQQSNWHRGMELLADLPEAVASIVAGEGTDYRTLADVFGLELLAILEGDVIWQFLLERNSKEMRYAVLDTVADAPWSLALHGLSPVQKFRVIERLTEDVLGNLQRVLIFNPAYRAWLF